MEQTWRWFGDDDPIPLAHVAQAGATGIVTALHHLPTGERWPAEEIARRKATIEASGLSWSVCELIPVDDAIKLGGAGAQPAIDAWKDCLGQSRPGRRRRRLLQFHARRRLDAHRPRLSSSPIGGLALRFDIVDFVGYDVFVLKRPHAAGRLRRRRSSQRAQRASPPRARTRSTRLERNIIAGLPGGAAAQTRASIADRSRAFDGVGDAEMRDNLVAVPARGRPGRGRGRRAPRDPSRRSAALAVRPAARRLHRRGRAAHSRRRRQSGQRPDALRGLLWSRADNDVVAMAREFAPRIHFAHLRNVTIEPDGSFHEAEHLDGGADMVDLIDVLLREERAGEGRGTAQRHSDAPRPRPSARRRRGQAHQSRLFLYRPAEGPRGTARRDAGARRLRGV